MERGILFSGPMIRAILDGRKTQTRRAIVPQPTLPFYRKLVNIDGAVGGMWTEHGGELGGQFAETRYCKLGQPGDQLWVREAFAIMLPSPVSDWPVDKQAECTIYRATHMRPEDLVWRPSSHMPRWASRLTLEVVSVRVQRVQEITFEDILSEGLYWDEEENYLPNCEFGMAQKAFAKLWDSINAKRGFGWDVSPWVWAIEFKRV